MGRRVTSAVCDIGCDNRSINSTIGCEPSDTCLSMFLLKYVPLPLPFTGMAMQDSLSIIFRLVVVSRRGPGGGARVRITEKNLCYKAAFFF